MSDFLMFGYNFRQWAYLIPWYRRTTKSEEPMSVNFALEVSGCWESGHIHAPLSVEFEGITPELDYTEVSSLKDCFIGVYKQ